MAYNQNKNPFSKSPLNFSSPLNSFDSLVGKLMNQGKSKEAATKIAGKVANAKMKGAGSGPTAAQKARAKGSPAKLEEKSPAKLKSPAEKKLVGKQKNLPEHLKAKIEAAPESPAKMKSPIKAHDKKLKALEKRIKRVRQSKEGSEGQGGIDYELLSQLEEQKKKLVEDHAKQAKETKDSPAKMKDSKTGKSHMEMSDKEKSKHMGQHRGKGKRPSRPEASKKAADLLNAKNPPSAKTRLEKSGVKAKDSPANLKGIVKGVEKVAKIAKRAKIKQNAASAIKQAKAAGSAIAGAAVGAAGKMGKAAIKALKKKSPLNNAYENPEYFVPTKSSYGQDMDNFFNTVNNAYANTQTDENRLERANRIKSKFEEKPGEMKEGLSDRQQKRYNKFDSESKGLEDKIGRAGFDIDSLTDEQINALVTRIKNRP